MKNYSITTKTGDTGNTSLLDSSRIAKHDMRPEVYGTLDEAVAFIGLARAKTDLEDHQSLLLLIQNHVYLINSELACPVDKLELLKTRLHQDHLRALEEKADPIEQELDLPRKFVLYGQTEAAAYLDVARSVVRRAERRLSQLLHLESIDNPVIPAYINRLSDVLFLLARAEEFRHKVPYLHPSV